MNVRPMSCMLIVLAVLATKSAFAVVIEMKPEAQSRGTIVRLADVATVTGDDARLVARLEAIELFPAPNPRGWSEIDHRGMLSLLEVRGFDPLGVSLQGARSTVIHGSQRELEPEPSRRLISPQLPVQVSPRPPIHLATATPSVRPMTPTVPVDPHVMAIAKPKLAKAIADRLRSASGGSYDWQPEPQIDPRDAELFASGALEVHGGSEPWSGRQQFKVRVHRADGIVDRYVHAEIKLPERIVATNRHLKTGDIVTAADLQLIVPTTLHNRRNTLTVNDEIIGLEVTRGVAEGQALTRDMLRKQIVVRRNSLGQLTVRAGGVTVGMKVRAMGDGAVGDAIRVQALEGRQEYLATVVGPQAVEIVAE